jgi:hypothetical protein
MEALAPLVRVERRLHLDADRGVEEPSSIGTGCRSSPVELIFGVYTVATPPRPKSEQ